MNLPESCIERWNRAVTVGSWVLVSRDDGSIEERRTRSDAWLFDSGKGLPVIILEGISGCYLLDRCTPIVSTEKPTP